MQNTIHTNNTINTIIINTLFNESVSFGNVFVNVTLEYRIYCVLSKMHLFLILDIYDHFCFDMHEESEAL